MEMEQMTACLLTKMKAEIRINQAKMDVNLEEMKEEMMARLEAKIQANNEKLEVLQGTIISHMDSHQART
jgi:exoribonuclease II